MGVDFLDLESYLASPQYLTELDAMDEASRAFAAENPEVFQGPDASEFDYERDHVCADDSWMSPDRDCDDPFYDTAPDARRRPALTDRVSYELFALLGVQEVADVPEGDLLAGMSAWQRVIGFATSKLYAQLVELHARRTGPAAAQAAAARVSGSRRDLALAEQAEDLAAGSAGDEIALELSWSRTRADRALQIAFTLHDRMPATLDALATGELEVKKAEVLATEIGALDDDQLARRVEHLVLEKAAGWNVPRLREEIKTAVLTLAPQVAAERAAKARAGRKVRFWAEPDEMIRMEALLCADEGIRLQTALGGTSTSPPPC